MKRNKILTSIFATPFITLSATSVVACAQHDNVEEWKISFQATEGATLSFTELKLKKGQIVKWSQLKLPEVTLDPDYKEIGWFDSTDYLFPDLYEGDLEIKSDTVLKFLAYNKNQELIRVKLFYENRYVTCPAISGFTWKDFKEFYGLVDPQKEHFKFVGWMDRMTEIILKDDDVIASSMIIEPKFKQLEADFSYDSWEDVISHANKGLDDLKAFYKKDSFIGLERTILLNGQIHRVRVIGENHDIIADGALKGKTAPLTFELVNLVSDIYGYTLKTSWGAKNYEYLESELYEHLMSEEEVVWWISKDGESTESTTCNRSCLTMLKEENEPLYNNIKTVTKQTRVTADYTLKDYSTKIFPLSCTEMSLTMEHVMEQGKPYRYWVLNEQKEDEGARRAGRTKTNTKNISQAGWYHLNSAWTNDPDKTMLIHTFEGVCSDVLQNQRNAVTFAFCI